MSVIRKKPFIESVIESLTDEQKASLVSVMNGSENTVNASFTDLPEDDIAPVLFQLEPNNLKTGILIQGSMYSVLLAYHRFQDMQIYKLDLSKFTFEKINEYLDINELRRTVSGGSGGGSSGDSPKIYEVESFENVPAEILEQLNVSDIVAQVFNGGAIKKLGFVNQITNHLEILHLDGDIFNFYEYHKVDNEWSLDEHYQDVHPRVYAAYLSDIARLTYDELDILDLGDVVRSESETWTVSNFSEENEDFAIYLCKTTDESIVFVRYVYNEDDDEYTFDTSYGVNGYNVISLGGGSSGSVLDLRNVEPYDVDEDNKKYWYLDSPVKLNEIQQIKANIYDTGVTGETIEMTFDICPVIPGTNYYPGTTGANHTNGEGNAFLANLYFSNVEASSENSGVIFGMLLYKDIVGEFSVSFSIETDPLTEDPVLVIGTMYINQQFDYYMDGDDFTTAEYIGFGSLAQSHFSDLIRGMLSRLDPELVIKLMGEYEASEEVEE